MLKVARDTVLYAVAASWMDLIALSHRKSDGSDGQSGKTRLPRRFKGPKPNQTQTKPDQAKPTLILRALHRRQPDRDFL